MINFIAGNRIELLRTGAEFFPALQAACDAAEHEIYLETYIFADDPTGRSVATALARAARRGVTTHLLIDGFGSKELGEDFLRALRSDGVRVLKYRPAVSPWTLKRQRLRRLHRKIAVIDAKVAFVGGINIIDDMHTPNQVPPRFDFSVRIEGPLLAEIYPVVTRLWSRLKWTQLREPWPQHSAPPVRAVTCGMQRAAFVIRDNLRHRNDIENAYLEAISCAKSEIIIASAYFFPGRSFRRALVEAAARGVRVVLLLQGRVEYVLLHYASRALYGHLLEAGIEIHEYHRSFLHAKVAVIDCQWATVGSSNIDPYSLLLAREANIVIDDGAFARELRTSLNEAMAAGALQVERASWERRSHSLSMRIATWICYGMVRFLSGWSSYGHAREFT